MSSLGKPRKEYNVQENLSWMGVKGPVISNLRLHMKKDKIWSIYHITQKNKFHIEYKTFTIMAKNLAVIEGGNWQIWLLENLNAKTFVRKNVRKV